MTNEKFNKLEKRAKEFFGEKAVLSVADVKFANKGYITRIKLQGMPFEISAMQNTLEEAEELALTEFEKCFDEAIEKDLFPTQPIENYEVLELTDEQFKRLFKYEELLSEEYEKELKQKTKANICRLDDGRYECVLESPYLCLHARGTSGTITLAILSATMRAHDVFRAPLINVGKKPWKA